MKKIVLLVVVLVATSIYGGVPPSPTIPITDSTYYLSTGAGDSLWLSKHGISYLRVYNVTKFGAVGDSSADDRAAVLAAINAYRADSNQLGCVIYFPPGQYLISDTIMVPADTLPNIVFVGDGNSSILYLSGTGGIHVYNAASGNKTPVGIRDLKFQSAGDNTEFAIKLDSLSYSSIMNLDIQGGGAMAMGVYYYGGEQGYYLGGRINGCIESIHFDSTSGSPGGIYSNSIHISGVTITGGDSSTVSPDWTTGIKYEGSNTGWLTYNQITNCSTLVYVDSGAYKLVIANNHFETSKYGVRIAGGSFTSVENNSFYSSGVADLYLEKGHSNVISNNLFNGACYIGEGSYGNTILYNLVGGAFTDSLTTPNANLNRYAFNREQGGGNIKTGITSVAHSSDIDLALYSSGSIEAILMGAESSFVTVGATGDSAYGIKFNNSTFDQAEIRADAQTGNGLRFYTNNTTAQLIERFQLAGYGAGTAARFKNVTGVGVNEPSDTGYTLPPQDGTNGQVLKTNGTGTVTWQDDSNSGTSWHWEDSSGQPKYWVDSSTYAEVADSAYGYMRKVRDTASGSMYFNDIYIKGDNNIIFNYDTANSSIGGLRWQKYPGGGTTAQLQYFLNDHLYLSSDGILDIASDSVRLNGVPLYGLSDPLGNDYAVNKVYVDTVVSNHAGTGQWNSVGGDSALQWYAASDTGLEIRASNETTYVTPGANTVLVLGDDGITEIDSLQLDSLMYIVSPGEGDSAIVTNMFIDSIRAGSFGTGTSDSVYVLDSTVFPNVGWYQSGDTLPFDTTQNLALQDTNTYSLSLLLSTDTAIGESLGNYLNLAGGTMTGSIIGIDSLDVDSGLYVSDDITVTGKVVTDTIDGITTGTPTIIFDGDGGSPALDSIMWDSIIYDIRNPGTGGGFNWEDSAGEPLFWVDSSTYATVTDSSLFSTKGHAENYADSAVAESGHLTGNETITLSGDVTGSGTTAITTTVGNDSHNHTSSTISGLDSTDFPDASIGWEDIDTAGQSISHLGQSISDAEVDDNITASSYLPLAGGTMTGSIVGIDSLNIDSGVYISDDLTVTGRVITDTVSGGAGTPLIDFGLNVPDFDSAYHTDSLLPPIRAFVKTEMLDLTVVTQPRNSPEDSLSLQWWVHTVDTAWAFIDSTWQGSDTDKVAMIRAFDYDFDCDSVIFWYMTNGSIDTIRIMNPTGSNNANVTDSIYSATATGWTSTTLARVALPFNRNMTAGQKMRVVFVDVLADDNDRTRMLAVQAKGKRR